MELRVVPVSHIDQAWKDGAEKLVEACDTSNDEITGSQLKMILSRGERTLLQMWDGAPVGWGVIKVEQLPNIRVLMVTGMYGPGADFARFFDQLKGIASSLGCSRIRCAAKPHQARLYRMKCGFMPVYEILETEV
jgi:hypothetical protein